MEIKHGDETEAGEIIERRRVWYEAGDIQREKKADKGKRKKTQRERRYGGGDENRMKRHLLQLHKAAMRHAHTTSGSLPLQARCQT